MVDYTFSTQIDRKTYISWDNLKKEPQSNHDIVLPSLNTANRQLKRTLKQKKQLNKIIVTADSKPDYLAINMYFDMFRSWYVPIKIRNLDGNIERVGKLKTPGIYTSISEIAEEYTCSASTVRRKIALLEDLGLIIRSYQHSKYVATNSYNKLIIYVLKDTPYFFNPCGIDINHIKDIIPQTNHKYIKAKYGVDINDKIQSAKDLQVGGGTVSLDSTKELTNSFNKLKDRSNESNCFFKSSEDSTEVISNNYTNKSKSEYDTNQKDIRKKNVCGRVGHNSIKEESAISSPCSSTPSANLDVAVNKQTKNKLKNKFLNYIKTKKSRKLKDFYPVDSVDADLLRKQSGREFTDTAINEILLDMGRKLTKPTFLLKSGFISYMAKALKHEKRQATLCSGTSFKIKANLSDQEQLEAKQEQYLTEIEYSLQVSPEWHLKKKLASVLERSKAYEVLKSYRSISIEEGVATITLDRQVELSRLDRQVVLQQIKASHEGIARNTNQNRENIEEREENDILSNYQPIERLAIKVKSELGSGYRARSNRFDLREDSRGEETRIRYSSGFGVAIDNENINASSDEMNLEPGPERPGIWGKIRSAFARYLGDKGAAIDAAWISKLEAKIDEENGSMKLIAPSSFVYDYVNCNYRLMLERSAKEQGLVLESIGI